MLQSKQSMRSSVDLDRTAGIYRCELLWAMWCAPSSLRVASVGSNSYAYPKNAPRHCAIDGEICVVPLASALGTREPRSAFCQLVAWTRCEAPEAPEPSRLEAGLPSVQTESLASIPRSPSLAHLSVTSCKNRWAPNGAQPGTTLQKLSTKSARFFQVGVHWLRHDVIQAIRRRAARAQIVGTCCLERRSTPPSSATTTIRNQRARPQGRNLPNELPLNTRNTDHTSS